MKDLNTIICGDAVELAEKHIEPASVDLILTDPPYLKQYIHLYEWLAIEAVRVLKPNGFLLVYCGAYWKSQVMAYLNKKLSYFWDFILLNGGNSPILWQRKIISRYKSILAYHKEGAQPLPQTNVLGCIQGFGGDKRYHKWGQDEHTARYYMECFSKENDLVVDYFVGGGTVPFVCQQHGRYFIGFENDPQAFTIAEHRIRTGMALGKDNQLELDFVNQNG